MGLPLPKPALPSHLWPVRVPEAPCPPADNLEVSQPALGQPAWLSASAAAASAGSRPGCEGEGPPPAGQEGTKRCPLGCLAVLQPLLA